MMLVEGALFGTGALGGVTLLAAADNFWQYLGQMGDVLALGLAALGSAIGIGMAGQAAAGAWARESRAGKTLSFTYIILLGMPISQTLYAMIVMNRMHSVFEHPELAVTNAGLMLGIGLATGLGEMFSAWMQGLVGAAGIRALSEGEGKGFAFVIIAMGVVETVGIFAMVFMLGMIPALPEAAAAVGG
ncbi:MAG: V-type ATP synthase subunit K [Phycisphaerales bacterium]|nr:V-type ATP synthase subunit K [Phycisphaerales bacterium]